MSLEHLHSQHESAVPEALRGAVLVHTGPGTLQLALDQARRHPRSGLVYSGIPNSTARAAFHAVGGRVILDSGRWQREVATPEDPFGLGPGQEQSDNGFLLPPSSPTLTDLVASTPAAVSLVLTPTGFIPAEQPDLITAVLTEASKCDDRRLTPLIPIDAKALSPESVEQTCRLLSAAQRPVALILLSKQQPLSKPDRMAGLRTLLASVPDVLLLACEPAVGLDAVLHGASTTSIGITSGLRQPTPPPRSNGFATGYVTGMLLRDLWEHRSPVKYADWYRGRAEPACGLCPEQRSFASYDPGSRDKNIILRHNLHTWLAVLDELGQLPLREARAALANERRDALDRNAQLRPHATLSEFDPVLRQLVALDDGVLPQTLLSRRNR